MAVDILEEEQYLKGLTGELKKEADKLLKTTDYYSGSYQEFARYLQENRNDFDGEEMLFNLTLVDQMVDAGESTKKQFYRICKMLDSPYFARIDFWGQDDAESMKVYIGRFAFWDVKSPYEVFDWRAPIASMYYEFEDGEAYYDSPGGRVEGVIDCKRQYGISRGVLEYALESSVSIDDEVLRRELSKSADHRMKDIVATIQKEQNRLIRNESAEVLIIQGVAGSGKTSIALHRAAYFLYRYRNEISAANFLIISPNGIFVDYISSVLPELGEENIKNIGMEEIAERYLPKGFPVERLCLQTERFQASADEAWMERNAYKSTEEFVHKLDEYLDDCDRHNFHVTDYPYEGGALEAEFMEKRYIRQRRLPVRKRLEDIAAAMSEEIRIQRRAKGFGTHKNQILEWLMSRYRHNDLLELYRNFYSYIGRPELLVWEEGRELESADIFPLIYVRLYLEGGEADERIKYLIVDEMQDYAPIQYAVLNRLYPCRKTILGDFCQNVVPFVQGSLDYLKALYPEAEVIEIHKSYRSTCEIMNFAQQIQKKAEIDPILRHGEEPQVCRCEDGERMRERLFEAAREAVDRGNGGKLGIICKNYAQAEELYLWLEGRLKMHPKLHLLTYDSDKFYDGVMVTAVSMAKGLEFDEVMLPEADDWNYRTEYDRGLLYVACTRAMHKLTLLYESEPSRFIPASQETACGRLADAAGSE